MRRQVDVEVDRVQCGMLQGHHAQGPAQARPGQAGNVVRQDLLGAAGDGPQPRYRLVTVSDEGLGQAGQLQHVVAGADRSAGGVVEGGEVHHATCGSAQAADGCAGHGVEDCFGSVRLEGGLYVPCFGFAVGLVAEVPASRGVRCAREGGLLPGHVEGAVVEEVTGTLVRHADAFDGVGFGEDGSGRVGQNATSRAGVVAAVAELHVAVGCGGGVAQDPHLSEAAGDHPPGGTSQEASQVLPTAWRQMSSRIG
ncbi:hypothetical protein SMICM304S_00961 [Streptomyces microflavus]